MRYSPQATVMNATLLPAYAEARMQDIPTFPEMVTITTTLNCNYRCRMCYQQGYPKEEIAWEVIEKIGEALPFISTMQIFGGEPLLYSRFGDLVELCGENCVRPSTITNGSLLTRDLADSMAAHGFGEVKVSLDAGTAKTYAAIRGGNFNKVINNIAGLAEAKARRRVDGPFIELNFVAMKSNVHEIGRLAAIGANAGAQRLNVYYMNACNEESALDSLYFCQEYGNEQMLKGRDMAREVGMEINIPKLFGVEEHTEDAREFTQCHDPWKYLLVDVSGQCTPCCGGRMNLGSLADKSFQDIWNGRKIQEIRRTVNTENELPACRSCQGRKQKSGAITTHFASTDIYAAAAAKLGVLPPPEAPSHREQCSA